MNLLILNYPYLAKELAQLGHKVITAGHYDNCMVRLSDFTFAEISQKIDVSTLHCVIYADSLDEHFLYRGLEKFTCPTVYIGIDSTINYFWQQHYAQIFDLIFFDQYSEVTAMQKKRKNCFPLLLGFDNSVYRDYGLPKEFDITFAGRRNSQTRPKRDNLIKLLTANGFKINLIDGVNYSANPVELAGIYNRSRIVINENLFPGINLRLFEALGSSSLLFTEDSCPELNTLFNDGEDLVTYNAENIVEKLSFYLNHPQLADQIAKNGCSKVHNWHSDRARAEYLISRINEVDSSVKMISAANLHLATAALNSFLKWPDSLAGRINQQIMQEFYSTTQNILNGTILKLKIAILGNDFASAQKMLAELKINSELDLDCQQTVFWSAYQLGLDSVFKNVFSCFLEHKYKTRYQELQLSGVNSVDCYRLVWADHLYDNGKKITYGLTASLPEIFCTAFDFYSKCSTNPDLAEIALNRMADILVEGLAYDFAEQIYRRLTQLNPKSDDYRIKADIYRHKSYGA